MSDDQSAEQRSAEAVERVMGKPMTQSDRALFDVAYQAGRRVRELQAREERTEHEAIVRELAEIPILQVHYDRAVNGDLLYTCPFCEDAEPQSFEALHVSGNHEPECTWRRARALYPQPLREQESADVARRQARKPFSTNG